MRTSEKGVAFLERHEGVVLKAYRDVVGVWTIGAGLTAASGVVKPAPGMLITREEASRLLALALRANYEPAVETTMMRDVGSALVRPAQHEFDAGVSFHFNTGAIRRASWVAAWKAKDWALARAKLKLWNKGDGRVLKGLVRRREEEANVLQFADYGPEVEVRPPAATGDIARIAAPLSWGDAPAIRDALTRLGYGNLGARLELSAAAVRAFQAAHGLTVDGIVGRATASAIQRALDARGLAEAAALPAAVTVPVAATDVADQLTGVPLIPEAGLAGALVWGLWQAWQYRDVIAPVLDRPLPRVAAWLRSR